MKLIELLGSIPVEQAAQRTQRWREAHPTFAKSFALSITDLQNLMTGLGHYEPELKALRFYLGITQEGIPSLMMVGVKGDYDPDKQKGGVDILELEQGTDKFSLVFDFSCPCPYTCPEANELTGE